MIRILFFLLFFSFAISQNFYLNRFRSNDSLLIKGFEKFQQKQISEALIDEKIRERIKLAKANGFLFARAEITDFSEFTRHDSLFVELSVLLDRKKEVHLDSILFLNIKSNSYSNLLRESRLEEKQILKADDLQRAINYLNKSDYVEEVRKKRLFRFSENQFALALDIKELNTSFINGIIGYSPAREKKDAEITSDVELKFSNIAGSGRSVHFNWEKKSARSQRIKLNYREPWLFNFPIHQNFSIEQVLQDSIYSKWTFSTSSEFPINDYFSIKAGFSFSSISPSDSLQAELFQLPVSEGTKSSFGITYQHLDRRFNPRQGFKGNLVLSRSVEERIRPKSLIEKYHLKEKTHSTSLRINAQFYHSFFTNQVFVLKSSHLYQELEELSESDYVYFGGAKSLRGFRENQFKSTQIHQFVFEYRLLLGDKSRVSAFSDHTRYRFASDHHLHDVAGMGLGLRFETALGIVGLDYAFESDQLFKNAVIHFGIYGTID